MPKISYLNGQFLPHEDAFVHIEDRGFQFADGVYEVIAVYNGHLVYGDPHLARLERSLHELRIDLPLPRDEFKAAIHELIDHNGMKSGNLYMQISRGVAPRDHPFPPTPPRPTVVMTVKPLEFPEPESTAYVPCKVITTPDLRWHRCDIKTVSLLANCLAKQQATEAEAYEAVLFDRDGLVTECSSANAWMVTAEGVLRTYPLADEILGGILRGQTIEIARAENLAVEERAFSVEEFKGAREAFLTSTTPMVKSIGLIDETVVGNGEIGPITKRLLKVHRDRILAMTGDT